MLSKANYLKKLTVSLNDLRKQNELCDVIIHVSKKSFPAHRAVLAAASSYFRAMFASGFRESTDKAVNIDGDPDIFEELLNYAYTGRMKIRTKTAYALLEMACYLQFTDICQYCPRFIHLSTYLAITDQLKMYDLATSHEDLGMKMLASQIMKFSDVKELKSSDEFLKTADVSFLKLFLSQDDLSSEEDVLEMVISWLKCDWETRQPYAICLLEKVRLGLVSKDRLKELMDDEITDIPACQQLLQKLAKELSSGDSRFLAMNDPALFSRRGTITAPITLICEDDFIFKYFDFDERKWKEIPKFQTPPFKTSLIVANDTLYAIGAIGGYGTEGPCDDELLQQCWEYHSGINKWIDLPSTERCTGHSQSVFTDGFIYEIGHAGGGQEAERFDVAEEMWETLTSLPERFRTCTSAAIAYQGSIIGYGVEGVWNVTPRTLVIFSFNPKTNFWQTVMRDEIQFDEGKFLSPTLFKQAGHVYRILYKVNKNDRFRNDPVVNILELQSTEKGITHISVGQEVKQDLIPATSVGAFRIQEQVFVNVNRCVLLTRLKIKPNQNEELPRHLLEHFDVYPSFDDEDVTGSSNIVIFTFQKKLCINQESEEHDNDADSDEVDSDDSIDDEDQEVEDDDNGSNQ